MKTSKHIAIDLGAGSGRVILGHFQKEKLDVEIVHRFPNIVQKSAGHERWYTKALFHEIETGLKIIAQSDVNPISIGVDTWGVDYGLFNNDGILIEEPICYRDSRTNDIMAHVFERLPKEQIYQKTGIQFLPINTLFQLVSHTQSDEWPAKAARLLMMPDLFHYDLCGKMTGEYSDASTTGLLNVFTKKWDPELFAALELPLNIMPEPYDSGAHIGVLKLKLQEETGLPELKVIAPATHDTASAVVGTPLKKNWAYISSGTWSLVGIEVSAPIINDACLQANFTNEGGAFGSIRFLKNVMGLWILESCRKEWQAQGQRHNYSALLQQINATKPFQAFVNPDDLRFLNPANMVQEIKQYLEETAQPTISGEAAVSRLILESLALRYASVIESIQDITGEEIRGVHIIGGGSQNDFLNQATANATGLAVIAGPVEATAIGNLLVQAISCGRFQDVREARAFIQKTTPVKHFLPQNIQRWREAFRRYKQLEEFV